MDLNDLLLVALDRGAGWLNRTVFHVSTGPRPADHPGWQGPEARHPRRHRGRPRLRGAADQGRLTGPDAASRKLATAHGQRARLLRGARRRARRRRRRRSSAPSASSPSSGTRTSTRSPRPRSGSRRSTRPTRSSPIPSAARRTTCSARRASRAPAAPAGFGDGRASAASRDIFDAFFGGVGGRRRPGARRPQTGLRPPLRPPDHVRGGRPRAPRRRSSSRSSAAATRAAAPARSRARRRVQCPQCNGRGEIRSVRQTMLGQMVNVAAVPALPRRGQDRRVARARPATARAAPSARGRLRVAIPAGIDEGHQIRLSNEGEVGPRGGAPGSLYVAVHVPTTRPSPARAPSSTTRPTCRSPRRRSGTKLQVPTVDGEDAEVEIKPGHAARDRDPAPRPGRAAPAPAVGPRRPPRDRQRRRPDEAHASASASCSRRTRPRAARPSSQHARPAREAGPRVSAGARPTGRAPLAGHRPRRRGGRRRAPGWSSRSPPTTRPSRPCPRSCRAPRPAGRASSRRSSWSRRAWRRAWTSPGRRWSGRTCRSSTPAAVRAAVARAERDLGHLQAFGLRPIGDLEARRRPRGRLGERLEGALPGAAGRAADRDPADLAAPPPRARTTWCSRSTRAWRSGPGSTRRPGCASRRSSRWPTAGVLGRRPDGGRRGSSTSGSRVRDPVDRRRAARAPREVLAVDVDPIAVDATARERAAQPARARDPGARGQLAQRRGPVRRRPRQPDRVAC